MEARGAQGTSKTFHQKSPRPENKFLTFSNGGIKFSVLKLEFALNDNKNEKKKISCR